MQKTRHSYFHVCVWVLIIVFVSGCATVPITGRKQLSLVSYQQMAGLSNANYQQILKDNKLSDDAAQVALVQKTGNRIAIATEDFLVERGDVEASREFQWEFNLIEDDTAVNAFAMPGGKVFVYTGILPVTQNEDGLAAVIGHEIAHIVANHGGERMSQLLLVQLGGLSLAVAMREKPEKTKQMAMMAYGAGSTLGLMLPYSRLHENEADRIGLILMAKAGYDPREAINLWQRMNDHQSNKKIPEFLSTHPVPKTRIERIRQLIPEALQHYNAHK